MSERSGCWIEGHDKLTDRPYFATFREEPGVPVRAEVGLQNPPGEARHLGTPLEPLVSSSWDGTPAAHANGCVCSQCRP